MPFIQSQLQAITTFFPNEVTFISGARSGTPDDPRLKLNAVRSAIKLALFLPVLFLFGIAVFAVRSLRDLFTWWGWPLIMAGIISALVALVGSPIIGGILRILIQTQGAFFIPPILAAALAETATAVAREMLAPIVLEGFIMAIVGMGMLIVAFLVPRRQVDQII